MRTLFQKKALSMLLTAVFLGLSTSQIAKAAFGDPDPTFGTGGIFTDTSLSTRPGRSSGREMANSSSRATATTLTKAVIYSSFGATTRTEAWT
jgi:hypothetical protein